MNTDHLKYLIAIGKTKSMSQASESLYISPQALSMAIKKLEEELSMPLLKRSSSGTELTENGQWLVGLSSHFFDEIALRQEQYHLYLTGSPAKPHGTLDIRLNASGIGESQLAKIICNIEKKQEDFHIALSETSRDEVESAVSNGSVEMGFIYRTKYNKKYIDDLDESLVFYPLQRGHLVILAHEKFPFAKFDSTFLKTIVDYPICSFNMLSDQRLYQLLRLVTNKKVRYTSVNNYSLYNANIAYGNAIAITVKFDENQYAFNHIKEVNTVNVRDDIQVFFGVLRRKEDLLSTNGSFFWHKLLENYQTF